MDHFARGYPQEVIDLLSDSDDYEDCSGYDSDAETPGVDDAAGNLDAPANAIDLTELEDYVDEDAEVLSEVECLQMILNVLPDIAVDHVLHLIRERTQYQSRTSAECERLITEILDDGEYPKENDEVNKRKRKRDDGDDDIAEFEQGDQDINVPGYHENALNLLKDEFPSLPVRHIENTLQEHKALFKTFGILEDQLRNYNRISSTFSKLHRARNKRAYEFTLVAAGNALPKELQAAKKKSANEAAKRHKEMEAERAEEDNILRAQLNNEMSECLCCYDECPINRMTCCNGDTVHFFCKKCAKTYVEGEMGQSKCRPVCFADTACGGTFTRQQLLDFLGTKSFERLEHLQQQEDIAAAGLDFLSECPFCDFKAECPPIEIDKEFRCLNPKCEKTSCRLCQKETHIPLSCEEAKKDGNLTIRHVVEEAMSSALIRTCNRCKHPFVKEHGCNKMSCSHCHNTQCYVCSKDVTNYDHFSGGNSPNRCPLHDNVEARHEEEVKKAAAEALAKVRAEHPDISEAELIIQVSDRVKQAEQARRGQAHAAHVGFPFHMEGNHLIPGPVGQAPRPVPYGRLGAAPPPPVPNQGYAQPAPPGAYYHQRLGAQVPIFPQQLARQGYPGQPNQRNGALNMPPFIVHPVLGVPPAPQADNERLVNLRQPRQPQQQLQEQVNNPVRRQQRMPLNQEVQLLQAQMDQMYPVDHMRHLNNMQWRWDG